MGRTGEVERATKETRVRVKVNLDEYAEPKVSTGIGFMDHMLATLGKHSRITLVVEAAGDLEVDAHHLVEDVGICLGRAVKQALSSKAGIKRFGSALVPMDESLALCAVDLSGRPYLNYAVELPSGSWPGMDFRVMEQFFRAFATDARATVHLNLIYGSDPHHIMESIFKSFALALREAWMEDPAAEIPSTKGVLE